MDLRKPSGSFFLLTGALLFLLGAGNLVPPAPLSSVNVNLWVGCLMLLFGGVLLWLSKRAS
jgi:hypothetical protein